MTTDQRRVHVAGRGVVAGLGAGRDFLERHFAGESGIRPRQRSAAWDVPTDVAAEVPADCWPAGSPGEDPFALACLAARQALAEAGDPDPASVGLVLASTKADLAGLSGPCQGDGHGLQARLARRLADELGLGSVLASVSAACASGLMALALAERRLAAGDLERALVVGVDVLSEFVMAGFGSLHALDHEACRPFDIGRRGISLGEGAGAVLLSVHPGESLGVVLAGHGGANDAYHALRPAADGSGLLLAARRALQHAGVTPADIDVIHVHGTGTAANDSSEALGLGLLFDGPTPPAFGSKGQIGHTLGAAGVIETVVAIEALQRRRAGTNVGLVEPGVDPRVDLVREPRDLPRARHALKVAGGFGGVQSAIVLESLG